MDHLLLPARRQRQWRLRAADEQRRLPPGDPVPSRRDERAVTLTVWGTDIYPGPKAAPGSPKYLVDVGLHPAGTAETVAAAGIVDLMNLLATWTPVVQIGYVCDEAAERWQASNNR